MKLNKTREDLELELKGFISLFTSTVDNNEIDLIAEHLNSKHGLKITDVYSIFNNSNNIGKLSLEELYLFGEQIVVKLGIDSKEWLSEWFTKREQDEFSRYQFVDLEKLDEIDFPLVLKNVNDLGNGYYNATLTKQELARLYKYGKLEYNPNVQRGMKKLIRYGLQVEEPIIYKKKVEEIKNLILSDEFRPNTITLNAAQMSSTDGIELIYNETKHTLEITEGTVLDIVDGMHRVLANYSAYLEDKNIKGAFPITISNKSDEEVKLYQVDLDKHTKLTRGRISELSSDSYANNVIDILKSDGELKNRITSNVDSKNALKGNDLIPYKTMLTIIESHFKLKSVFEARQLADNIKEYLVYLFGYFGDHQKDEYKIIFDADIFEGHIVLMKKMLDKEIPFKNLDKLIDLDEFNISNPIWEKYKILNNSIGRLNKKDRKSIVDYFEGLVK